MCPVSCFCTVSTDGSDQGLKIQKSYWLKVLDIRNIIHFVSVVLVTSLKKFKASKNAKTIAVL